MNETQEAPGVDTSATDAEHEFFAASEAAADHEGRRHPRFDFRSCVDAMVYPATADAGGEPAACQVLTRDISRGGMSILHKIQLFPGQRLDVVLHDGRLRQLEVMWCRRLGAGCYSSGCRFAVVGE